MDLGRSTARDDLYRRSLGECKFWKILTYPLTVILSHDDNEVPPSYLLIMAEPINVHLVGSLPFASVEEVFVRASRALPDRLRRIPNGEVGPRQSFVAWQSCVFPPEVLHQIHSKGKPLDGTEFQCSLDDIKHTQYDEVAIESY